MTVAAPTYRAILVGNSYYPNDPHNLPRLNGPARDVVLLHRTLTDPALGLFREGDVIDLLDRDRSEVEQALEAFLVGCGPEDHVLLYYSGHGVLSRDDRLYFCARDTRVDYLNSTAISADQVRAMLDSSPAQRFMIVLDCCNSGTFTSKGALIPDVLRGPGQHVLSSTQRRQSAADSTATDDGPSPFTKHFCEGIATGNLGRNVDGFVTMHELFLYVRERLAQETGQRPLFEPGTDGDIAIARTPLRVTAATEERPVLSLSTAVIDIPDVIEGEELAPEVIEVRNIGGGELDWVATCDAPWVQVDRSASKVYLHLRPGAGTNRAVVSVCDRGRGGAQTVRLNVKVRSALASTHRPPLLSVSTDHVDLGSAIVGVTSPRGAVELRNLGDGELAARVVHADPWIRCSQFGQMLILEMDTSAPRSGSGTVRLASAGGDATITVTGSVESGPVLSVDPEVVDFGSAAPGEEVVVRVVNVGTGHLRWRSGQSGSFFTATAEEDGVHCVLTSHEVGPHRGTIWVESPGGARTLDVRAEGARRPRRPSVAALLPRGRRPGRRAAIGAAAAATVVATALVGASVWPGGDDGGTAKLSADRVFARVAPATVMIQTHLTATVTVPQVSLDDNALENAVLGMIGSGQIGADRSSIAAAMGQLIGDHPLDYLVPDRSADLRSTTVELDALGSGFFVTPNGYLVTNEHVVHPPDDEMDASIAKDGLKTFVAQDVAEIRASDDLPEELSSRLFEAIETFNAHYLQIGDTKTAVSVHTDVTAKDSTEAQKGRPAEIASEGEATPGKDVAILKIDGVSNAPTIPVSDAATVQPGNDVLVVGYPGDVLFHPALDPDSVAAPTVTSGRVSGHQEMSKGWTALQFENAISPGSSGSPVLDDRGRVVGIATFGSRDQSDGGSTTVAGHNFGVPSDVVREFLDRAQAHPAPSEFTKVYQRGLDQLWAHHDKAALRSFRAADQLYPGNANVSHAIGQAQQDIAAGHDRSGRPLWERAAMAVVLAVLVGAVVVLLVRRRHSRTPAPAPAVRGAAVLAAIEGDPVGVDGADATGRTGGSSEPVADDVVDVREAGATSGPYDPFASGHGGRNQP